MKKPLIVIAGPTACGKTASSVKLAKKINGEIISADSMQVYKYMDIGTAKIREDEKEGIKHYLVDELYPDEDYSVAVFQKMAKEYMNEIYNKGKVPILVGGTGFYINALVYDNNFTSTDADLEYRKELEKLAEEKGNDFLYEKLMEVDPKACEMIHKNNVKRVIRALEYFKQTGKQISAHNAEEKANKEPAYNTAMFVLNMDREKLYSRIDLRVDLMLKDGLVEEVKALLDKGYNPDLVSMQGLGYKEIVKYLKGEMSLEEAVFILKRDTRHFAKRQLTWFKHQCNGIWIDTEEFENNSDKISDFMAEKIRELNI